MDQGTIQILFSLLRSAIRGTVLTEEEQRLYSKERLAELLRISSRHDLSHLVAYGLQQNRLADEEKANIEKCIFKAVFREQRTTYEYGRLCNALEAAQIPFLPLKGSVIRVFYPEPWMRTSCDIDVLVQPKDLEAASSVLTEQCGYTKHGQGSHDVSFYSPSNIHVELHYELVEEGIANESAAVLAGVWSTATVKEGLTSFYEMPDAMYYFYHVAHMAKHFEHGGCGIRPFIDLSILDRTSDADGEARDALLRRGGLLTFANAARKLSRVWLEGEEHDARSLQMERYVLEGGVYGNVENRIAVQQQKKGGRIRYALSRILLPYGELKFYYPVLQKHPILTPVMQVRRWFKIAFCGGARRAARELSYNQSLSTKEADVMKRFLEDVGL
ncbi:MAG: nucleotidyltransferase family protein [Clostridia bacterium]|nr:nucleotidyltransferase family protein [Clostridia bacterium]